MYDTFSFVFTRIVNNLQLVFIDEGQKLWKKTATISKKNFRRRDSNWFHVKILFLFFERFQQQNHFAKKFKQQCYLLKNSRLHGFFVKLIKTCWIWPRNPMRAQFKKEKNELVQQTYYTTYVDKLRLYSIQNVNKNW